ncbi:MAG: mechanosensitive ion channel family protein [Steroidobacteraceae bacterium]|nr:mechanosensitive ion channel family protein [Steroidobacteraceae bacterium]
MSTIAPARRATRLRLALPLLLFVAWYGGPGVAAAQDAISASVADAPEPVELTIANRPIFTLRAPAFGRPPSERVQSIQSVVAGLVAHGGPLEVTSAETPEGVAVLTDGSLVFRVLNGDVNPETGETPQSVAAVAVRNYKIALAEMREAQDARALLPAVLHALAATLIAVLLLGLLWRSYRWLATRMRAAILRRAEQIVPDWGRSVVGPAGVERMLMAPVRVVAWVIAFLVLYEWLAYTLGRFPYTRPWGEALFANLAGALAEIASGIAGALPGLFFVFVIFYLTRAVARAVRTFFAGVEEGRISVQWVDETTARPTSRLINAVVWLFGFVAAYPYIPGSESEAFRGIGVFVGLMLSIGSSGIVNQAVSGLMLMYTRALRPGEFVQIGDTEGTVRAVGFVNTRIETLRHEEVSIPNAVIAATVTRNYSRLAGEGGVRVPTKVTIGYDVPWRQVRAMLLLAAERTQGVLGAPEPRVLQTALQDFYVEYTLLVAIADPASRPSVLDELHAHIQDVFNEHGVQIMSPNYEADPQAPKVVPREDWFKSPAQR